ncbi:endogenous retrovirus group K member 8 Gag polyprotein-like [Moschus berezovskii]|uniref:endogenous retrovirus group K member 8 Gag polyprotein-like n=1 Tax=Moschus berezovskii TaxID=68408 RepID=UPI0024447949|nr:endogenous retrovirus group K member 8 Gag polyprotein-like [Moschus berezovskii]
MGTTISKTDEPALKALKYMLKSRGLEISDTQAIKVWGDITRLTPWIDSANLFSCDTWDRVQTLARKTEIQDGEEPPLGFYPTISALKTCFAPEKLQVDEGETTTHNAERQWEQFDDERATINSGEKEGKTTIANNLWPPSGEEKRSNQTEDFLSTPSAPEAPTYKSNLYPPLAPPFKGGVNNASPWRLGESPWRRRTYPEDPWGTPSPFNADSIQAFPINVNPGGNRPASWYPWEAQDIKELKKAVAEDGPSSPWAETILQGLAHQSCTTQDWEMLCKAVLPSNIYIKCCAFFKEECHAQVERNQAANPVIPVTFRMLSGMADQWSTGPQQAIIPAPYTDQVRAICLAPWRKLAEGPSEPPISGITQKNNEDLSTFIDRVEKSMQRKFPSGPLRDQFVKMLVWEGMNSNHKVAWTGQKDRAMEQWVVATKDIGTQHHQTQAMVAAMEAQIKAIADALASVFSKVSIAQDASPEGTLKNKKKKTRQLFSMWKGRAL